MKQIILEILNDEGKIVRSYYTTYEETEGNRMRLTIGDNSYIMNTEGKFVILTQKEIEREIKLQEKRKL